MRPGPVSANPEDDEIERALRAIEQDRRHGAAELADQGVALLVGLAEAEARAGRAPLPAVRALARRLRDLRPSMAPIGNWAAAFVAALVDRQDEPEPWRGAQGSLARTRQAIGEGQRAAARTALAGVHAVLTLSYSSTVARLLGEAAAPRRVIVAEGRPLLEGRLLVDRLHAAGRDVICITDAAMPRFVAEAGAVLIGADTLGRDGGALNKIGSLSAALAARHAGVPFFVAADRFKLTPTLDARDIPIEAMAGAEVWPERGALCRNPYFEVVPAAFITAFIMESGVHAPAALGPALGAIAAMRRALD